MEAVAMDGKVILGRYRIVRPLARGGMGMVYLGRLEGAAGFAKPAVIKTVVPALSSDKHTAELFAREARIASNLQHPNIVQVLDFGQSEGAYVMVLEYVHGYHLGQWLRFLLKNKDQMPVSHAVHVVLKVLDALDYAHSLTRPDGTPLGIVHRDISPANILLDVQGGVKLHDFGIARMADDEYKTQDGTFRGTLPYMPPEVLQGTPAESRHDVYACGVVLYQLIAGSNPFKTKQPSETLHRVLMHVPPPLSVLREDVPPGIDAAIAKVLSKNPDDRFSSAKGFANVLREAREWSHEAVTREFAQQVCADFSNDLPESLEIESLDLRDAAWRAAQEGSQQERISLSTAPPADGTVDRGATTQQAPPRTLSSLSGESIPVTRHVDLTDSGSPERTKPTPRKLPWFVAAISLLIAVTIGGAMWLRNSKASTPKLLVIEKEKRYENATPTPQRPTTRKTEPAPAAPTTSDNPANTTPSRAPKAPSSTPKSPQQPSRSARLSAAFQHRQGRVAACFRNHASDVQGQPQISIRFSVGTAGTVESAELRPASLGGSALGSCLLATARSTNFGPQPEPVVFSIPITARRVQN